MKERLSARSVHRRLLAMVLAMPLILATVPTEDDSAANLRAKASQILDHSAALARIWPGYWPETQAFILYEPTQGAVLVGADERPRDVTYRPGTLPGAEAYFVYDYPAGTPNMMMIKLGDSWARDAEVLFHEQFHDFQKDAFDRKERQYAGEYVDLTGIADRATFTAGAELERRVLADALMAKTATGRTDLIRRYLALRRTREATVAEPIIGRERYLERYEGSAQYVGLTAAAIVLGKDSDSVAGELERGLRRSLFANEQGSYSGNWFRTRAYDVGGAIALLLDRLGAVDWKARVQSGDPLDLVLESSLASIDRTERDRLVATTRARYAADKIFRDVKAALAAMPKTIESKADFMNLTSRYLVLSISIPVKRLSEGRQFSSTKAMIPVGRSTTALLDINDFQLERPGISVRLQRRSVMTEFITSKPPQPVIQIYTIALKPNEILSGLDYLPEGVNSLKSVALSASGLTVNVDMPVKATVAGDRIVLETSVAD